MHVCSAGDISIIQHQLCYLSISYTVILLQQMKILSKFFLSPPGDRRSHSRSTSCAVHSSSHDQCSYPSRDGRSAGPPPSADDCSCAVLLERRVPT